MKCPNCGRPVYISRLPRSMDGSMRCPYCHALLDVQEKPVKKEKKEAYAVYVPLGGGSDRKEIKAGSKEELLRTIEEDPDISEKAKEKVLKMVSKRGGEPVEMPFKSLEEAVEAIRARDDLSEEEKEAEVRDLEDRHYGRKWPGVSFVGRKEQPKKQVDLLWIVGLIFVVIVLMYIISTLL